MHTHVVHTREDIVAIKIIHYSSFFFFFLSFHILFSQKGFTYDFEFLDAFLSNKKNKIEPQKLGGTPLHPPKSSFLGGQQAKCLSMILNFCMPFKVTKKKRFSHKKMGGTPPSPPKSSFLGGQQVECVRYG